MLKPHRHHSILAILAACATLLATGAWAMEFEEFEIEPPLASLQLVLMADILADPGQEIVAFCIDEQARRHLLIYQYSAKAHQYQIRDDRLIPDSFYGFDVTKPQKNLRQKLYFLSSHTLARYEPGTGATPSAITPLATINTIVLQDKADYLSQIEFIYDINKDYQDDAIIADFESLQVWVGQTDGSLIKQTLPIKAEVSKDGDSAIYTPATVFLADMNKDGIADIAKADDGQLRVFLQQENGTFSTETLSVPIQNSIHGIDWWYKRDSTGEGLDQSHLRYRKLEKLQDINNDQIPDMVVRYTTSSGVLDKANDYEVYLGKLNATGIKFADTPNSVIRAEGTLTGIKFEDLDGDDLSEVLLAGFDISLTQIIGALLSGSIDQNVYIFKMDEHGNFPKKANIHEIVDLKFSITSGRSGSALVKLADLDGDGHKELLLSKNTKALSIYRGKKGVRPFNKKPTHYKTHLPEDGDQVLIGDLNNDGKQDLLFNYGSLDNPNLNKTIKVLLSH